MKKTNHSQKRERRDQTGVSDDYVLEEVIVRHLRRAGKGKGLGGRRLKTRRNWAEK